MKNGNVVRLPGCPETHAGRDCFPGPKLHSSAGPNCGRMGAAPAHEALAAVTEQSLMRKKVESQLTLAWERPTFRIAGEVSPSFRPSGEGRTRSEPPAFHRGYGGMRRGMVWEGGGVARARPPPADPARRRPVRCRRTLLCTLRCSSRARRPLPPNISAAGARAGRPRFATNDYYNGQQMIMTLGNKRRRDRGQAAGQRSAAPVGYSKETVENSRPGALAQKRSSFFPGDLRKP
eukprot:gene14747-biopygen7477